MASGYFTDDQIADLTATLAIYNPDRIARFGYPSAEGRLD